MYWVSLEFRFRYKHGDGYKHGFTYVFLRAKDVPACLSKLTKILEKEELKPVDIEFIKPYPNDMSWSDPARDQHYRNLVAIAQKKMYAIDHLYVVASPDIHQKNTRTNGMNGS